MSFYTDEQLSMMLSSASVICADREENDEIFFTCDGFICDVVGRCFEFTTPTQLLRELEKNGLA